MNTLWKTNAALRSSPLVALAFAAFILPLDRALADTHVMKEGSIAPVFGIRARSFMMVESAVNAALAQTTPGTVLLSPGQYREPEPGRTLIINPPPGRTITLTAEGSGATIGDLSGVASQTVLTIVTQNTRLFGDGIANIAAGYFKDDLRARQMGREISRVGADIAGLQELWDQDLLADIKTGAGGSYTTFGSDNNSGLALLSNYSLTNKKDKGFDDNCPDFCQNGVNKGKRCSNDSDCPRANGNDGDCDFTDCWGDLIVLSCCVDCAADKGWLRASFIKDGFNITVFNTHADAGQQYLDDPDDCGGDAVARLDQFRCIFKKVDNFRINNPNHVVFVMGDFNVVGDDKKGTEYSRTNIQILVQNDAARDAARNAPQWAGQGGGFTNDDSNNLAKCIDGTFDPFRFDYIYYFPTSRDGSIEVLPVETRVERFAFDAPVCCSDDNCEGLLVSCTDLTGPSYCDCFDCERSRSTREVSDHWAVLGKFRLSKLD